MGDGADTHHNHKFRLLPSTLLLYVAVYIYFYVLARVGQQSKQSPAPVNQYHSSIA
jgi:hypothetical protein